MTRKRTRTRASSKRFAAASTSGLELTVRKAMTQLGIRWRSGKSVRGFYPDLYLPDLNTVVEVNGCYWHACKRCFPKSRRKVQPARDRQKLAVYRRLGYNVIVLWEHDIVHDPSLAILESVS